MPQTAPGSAAVSGAALRARPCRPARPAPRAPRLPSSPGADLGQRELELEARVQPAAALHRQVELRKPHDRRGQLRLRESSRLLTQLLRRERLQVERLLHLGLTVPRLEHDSGLADAPDMSGDLP